MPLILLCGGPCCGKSLRALQLKEYFELKNRMCVIIQDEDFELGLLRNDIFADLHKEKELRSFLKSQVQRYISKDTIVVLDSGNYIKGYRYELYCLSKASKTTHCVNSAISELKPSANVLQIHCDVLPENSWEFNIKREDKYQYTKEIFDALQQRFEEPDSRNRWDSPLFILRIDEKLPFNEIDDALFNRKAPPPNLATQSQPLASTNFLYDLDRITQDIVKAILDLQKTSVVGDTVTVPGTQEKICFLRPLTPVELTRLRRQFISYSKVHPVYDTSRIPNMFVQYLNSSIVI